jgi:mycothiol synthase
VILGSAGAPAGNDHALEFISYAQQRGINLADVWIAERAGQIATAMLPVISPGRTMLLLMPADQGADIAADVLMDTVCQAFADRGFRLAQALLDPAEPAMEKRLVGHGFRRMAELIYLHVAVRSAEVPTLPQAFALHTYSPHTHALFAETVSSSYHGSLDCPGLNGVRDIEDVLAGHKSSGEFDPKYWFVLEENGQGRGVLLLSRLPNCESTELVYLGLTPEARSRGLSDLLMRQALAATAQMGQSRLSLAVDSGNLPALRLYYRFGMSKVASKIAMMRELKRDKPEGQGDSRNVERGT